jgi:hypothetical protein
VINQNTGSGQYGNAQLRTPANQRGTYQTPKNTLNKAAVVVFHGAGASKKTGGGKCTAEWTTPFGAAK